MSLTEYYLQKKYTRALKSELRHFMDNIVSDEAPMDTSVWQRVIKHMYNEEDFEKLQAQIISGKA